MGSRRPFSSGPLRGAGLVLAVASVGAALGCSGDFDTSRSTPPRGSLGRELYSMVCDRIGAQALREDVTGSSYHAICHPDPIGHAYAAKVDASLLVPLDPQAHDGDGHAVSLAVQEQNRAHRIARVEAIGRKREDLVAALDAAIPDAPIPIKDLTNPDPTRSCGPPADTSHAGLHAQLAGALGRFTDLYDDRTIPLLTEAFAHVLDTVKASPEAQTALTRMDARQGYRPSHVAIGVAQPLLAYPRLVDFANALLALLATDSDPYAAGLFDPTKGAPAGRKAVPGKASDRFQQLLRVLHEELRTSTADPALAPLVTVADTNDPTRPIFARPLGSLELTRKILFPSLDDAPPPLDASSRPLVRRDARGVAMVRLIGGKVPAPFLDQNGDGLADLDGLGQFLTSDGSRVPSPFFSVDGQNGPRTNDLALAAGAPMYEYFDTRSTILAKVASDLVPLFDATPGPRHEAILGGVAGGLPILFGSHDVSAASQRTYPPDPTLPQAWALQHPGKPPPANLGASPVVLPYAAYHAEDSPLVDLVYAVGQVLADPTTDDTLNLFRQLTTQHPDALARLVGVGLKIKAIADQHPEAHIPEQSTLWDELLDAFAKIAAVYDPKSGGILEDLIAAFGKDQTVALRDAFTAYIDFKDELTYQSKVHPPLSGAPDLNATAFDLTANAITPMAVPVDRTRPDTGANRSALQRFMQLLHDANGLGACTKPGAVAHLNLTIPGFGTNLAVDYPTGPLAKAACLFVGGGVLPPDPMPECGILRIPNVAQLLLSVALGRAKFDIPDPCLNAILANPTLTGLVGGPDAFLEAQSGIKGFSLHPTVNGISRLVYYDTPHDADPGDPSFPTTLNFLKDVIDPVPSMACDPAPFTDPISKIVIPLRKCKSFDLTLRGRDLDALFPLEQMDFIKNVQPLAAAFDDHGQPLLFVELFDTLHRHWGSPAQSKAECDPSLPKSDARWCTQDGTVSYEALLSEALKTDLFQALHDFIPLLQSTKVEHCLANDPTTGKCTSTAEYDGVHVLSEAVRALLDPARAAKVGLTDRRGAKSVTRNDGTTNAQVTPIYLLIDALKGFDRAFTEHATASHGDTTTHDAWRGARSQLVDTFFAVSGAGSSSAWQNAIVPRLLPALIDALRGDLAAYCPTARVDGACPWARRDLAKKMSDMVDGPMFAAVIDLFDAIRTDDAARTELDRLLQYLLGASTPEAQQATVTALHDVLQLFEDDANLTPLIHALAEGTGPTLVDDAGNVVRRSAADALIEVLARVLARAHGANGEEVCADEIDPNRSLATVLSHLVAPMPRTDGAAGSGASPLEVLIDAIAAVNRAHPEVDFATKLAAADYASIASEVSDFCENKESGLEQVYEVIREATLN